MNTNLKKALAAAKQFGGEAQANGLPSFSGDDRSSIAQHYGVGGWAGIPKEHQDLLLFEYQKGERLERVTTHAGMFVNRVTDEWTAGDWEEDSFADLEKKAEEFLEQSYFGSDLEARIAFEKWMGW